MNISTTLLALCWMTRLIYADPNADEQAFLNVQGSRHFYRGVDERTFDRETLPKPLVAILDTFDWGESPSSFLGYEMDLNRDGRNEYFIETIYGGSGGPAFAIFSEIEGSWKTILNFQGGFHVIPTEKGWPALMAVSRGGGGNFCKSHFKFEKAEYVEVLRENYKRGVIKKTVRP